MKGTVEITDIADVRYGELGKILFEVKGRTHFAKEPMDVMPAESVKGTNRLASLKWALEQVVSGNAWPIKKN